MNLENNTALIVMDMQCGFDNESYWGGNRNNPDLEKNIVSLLSTWRKHKLPVFHVIHDSILPESILKINRPEGALKKEIEIQEGETIVYKKVNSAFIGTNLDLILRRQGIQDIIIVGLTTNHCVSTTARMGGNLGYKVFVPRDGTATFDRMDEKGNKYPAEIVHNISLANLHEEFCTVCDTADITAKING